jgi:outer membrane protein TolC
MMKTFLYIASSSIICFFCLNVNSQSTTDSLSLAQVMQTVLQSHPGIKEAEEAISIAEAKIGYAKSGYYPNVDVTGSYSHVGPTPSIPFPMYDFANPPGPMIVNFQLYPADNYSGALNYNQVLYDFGKTKQSVSFEKENKKMAEKNSDLAKQRLSSLVATNFYSLVFLQEAVKIKDKELQILREHLEYVEKKKATGSATKYELLSVQVKISATENQKVDLEASQKIQQAVLRSLMGLPVTASSAVKQDINFAIPGIDQDSLLNYAFSHRLEMDLSKEKETITGLQYNLVKSQNNPVVNLFASAGGKNGYPVQLNEVKFNYAAGIGLKIPIFDGNRLKYNLAQTRSAATNASYESEITRRTITNEVVESDANRVAALRKIKQFELQVAQAEEALALAKIKFSTGSITNIELFDAENDVFSSRLMLLKSKVDYAVSVFKLNISLGNKMY